MKTSTSIKATGRRIVTVLADRKDESVSLRITRDGRYIATLVFDGESALALSRTIEDALDEIEGPRAGELA